MSKDLTITERDGAVDLNDIVFTIEGESCTAQMVFDAFKSARLKVAEQARQIAELQVAASDWERLHGISVETIKKTEEHFQEVINDQDKQIAELQQALRHGPTPASSPLNVTCVDCLDYRPCVSARLIDAAMSQSAKGQGK